jgi:hypothetical protein
MDTVLTPCGDQVIISSFDRAQRLIGTAVVSREAYDVEEDKLLFVARPEARN